MMLTLLEVNCPIVALPDLFTWVGYTTLLYHLTQVALNSYFLKITLAGTQFSLNASRLSSLLVTYLNYECIIAICHWKEEKLFLKICATKKDVNANFTWKFVIEHLPSRISTLSWEQHDGGSRSFSIIKQAQAKFQWKQNYDFSQEKCLYFQKIE